MEVCKIKKEGYPFRMTYKLFWVCHQPLLLRYNAWPCAPVPTRECVSAAWTALQTDVIVKSGYNAALKLDDGIDPRAGCVAVAEAVLPGPTTHKDKASRTLDPAHRTHRTHLQSQPGG